MGRSCFDYDGYHKSWLVKSDLTPKQLKKYGINCSLKEIEKVRTSAIDGSIVTGGRGYRKHIYTYSISKLKDLLRK